MQIRNAIRWVPALIMSALIGCTVHVHQNKQAKPTQPEPPKGQPDTKTETVDTATTGRGDARPATPSAAGFSDGSDACGAFALAEDESIFHLTANRVSTWEPGTTLNVVFMDGRPENMQKVAKYANRWTQYANIQFRFFAPNQAPPRGPQVRISFQRPGYWSVIGSQAAHRRTDVPTMNLNFRLFSRSEAQIRRTVLHEFGHALGLHHEHQNPKLDITWDKPTVYAYYKRTHGWNKAMVDNNVFGRLTTRRVRASAFDIKSIMAYSFPARFTRERIRIPYNTQLSPTDKSEIATLYPGVYPPRTRTGTGTATGTEIDVDALSRQVSIDYGYESADANGRIKNYNVALVASAAAAKHISHVHYQRQHNSFREFVHGTYYRVVDRSKNFLFSWKAWGWVPIRANVVWRNGKVTSHWRRQAPRQLTQPTPWLAIKSSIRFQFTQSVSRQRWRNYRVKLATPKAGTYIHWIEYQRQHTSFREYAQGGFLRQYAANNGFEMAWRGYGWTPVVARVRFKDGTTHTYRVSDQPALVRE